MTFEESLARAEKARQLLDNALFKEAFERVEGDILAEWRATADQVTAERCHKEMRALGNVRQRLKAMLYGGAVAEAEIKARKL